jgi:hypothetical protein
MTPRRRKRHKPERIVGRLRDANAMLNAGKDLAAVLQVSEISAAPPADTGRVAAGPAGDGYRRHGSSRRSSGRPVKCSLARLATATAGITQIVASRHRRDTPAIEANHTRPIATVPSSTH